MSKIRLLAVAATLAFGTSAFAQFSNASSSPVTVSKAPAEGWNTFYVQWNPMTVAVDMKGADDLSVNAFSVGYNKAFGIAKGTPLFVEAGIGLQYMFKTDEEPYEDNEEMDDYGWQVSGDKYSMLSAKVPVSLAYCWTLPNGKVDLIPNVGIDLRFNVFGKKNAQFEVGSKYDGDEKEDYEEMNDSPADKNLFDKDDMGSKDATWKRFQIGWHIGVNARFNQRLLLGLSYGTDFSELCKKTTIKTTSVTLGYCF